MRSLVGNPPGLRAGAKGQLLTPAANPDSRPCRVGHGTLAAAVYHVEPLQPGGASEL
jgi:hypothetical protein